MDTGRRRLLVRLVITGIFISSLFLMLAVFRFGLLFFQAPSLRLIFLSIVHLHWTKARIGLLDLIGFFHSYKFTYHLRESTYGLDSKSLNET